MSQFQSIAPKVFKGKLTKKGSSFIGSLSWQERFFLLEHGTITYFEPEHLQQTGARFLSGFTIDAAQNSESFFIRLVSPPGGVKLVLKAKNSSEFDQWLQCLEDHIHYANIITGPPTALFQMIENSRIRFFRGSENKQKEIVLLPTSEVLEAEEFKELTPHASSSETFLSPKFGWIEKQGWRAPAWKLCYFVLKEGILRCFNSESMIDADADMKAVSLSSYKVDRGFNAVAGYFEILLTDPTDQFVMKFPNLENCTSWYDAIQEHAKIANARARNRAAPRLIKKGASILASASRKASNAPSIQTQQFITDEYEVNGVDVSRDEHDDVSSDGDGDSKSAYKLRRDDGGSIIDGNDSRAAGEETEKTVVPTQIEAVGSLKPLPPFISASQSSQQSSKPLSIKGLVQKQGHVMKNWKTRFFLLRSGVLQYYPWDEETHEHVDPFTYVPVEEEKLGEYHLKGYGIEREPFIDVLVGRDSQTFIRNPSHRGPVHIELHHVQRGGFGMYTVKPSLKMRFSSDNDWTFWWRALDAHITFADSSTCSADAGDW